MAQERDHPIFSSMHSLRIVRFVDFVRGMQRNGDLALSFKCTFIFQRSLKHLVRYSQQIFIG